VSDGSLAVHGVGVDMSEKELLGIVLVGLAMLMFVAGVLVAT
jgi:hypothetical protein